MFSDMLPVFWKRRAENPLFRYRGYDQFRTSNLDPNRLRDALWKAYPSASKVPIATEYWRNRHPPLNADDEEFWLFQTGIKDQEQRDRKLQEVREDAWQVVQEFSLARWWFLRNIMGLSPYYQELRELARDGATIVDLGCGLGQDLRRLRADGATGQLYGVDSRPQLHELAFNLFRSDDKICFRKIDFRTGVGVDFDYDSPYSQNLNREDPLTEVKEKVDVYLLNDVLSFWGAKQISAVEKSINSASRVGTKVFGWQIGQDGEPGGGMEGKEVGNSIRGLIPTLGTFTQSFGTPDSGDSSIKWDVKAQLVGFDKMGFDEDDQIWFRSDFWETNTGCDRPNELKAICFLATRTQ
jgi:SAM-dependent methyltransferase